MFWVEVDCNRACDVDLDVALGQDLRPVACRLIESVARRLFEVAIQSGAPFTVSLGVDRADIGAGPEQRPDQVADPNLSGGERTPDRWFDTSAFVLQAPFTFGSAPRNSVIGPGFANVDFALARTMALGGQARLDARWEIFNLLNRTNFDLPNRVFGTPNFGRIFSAKNPREMQFGLRLSF